jgi:hypothetical protein
MKPWNRIKFAAALKSRADHPLSNFEVHDEVCARCGRERTFANMKHTRLYGYMCVCGAQEWVAAQQSVVCPEKSSLHYVQGKRLLAGASPVLVRVRPPGSRQPM